MKKFQRIFVTVGTTEFNSLIKKLQTDEVYEILKNLLGCTNLILQIGHGEKINFNNFKDIDVDIFDLKETIASDISNADLVISHAGAGTCIDVLSRKKPLIVVINDTLMNNHQVELAEQLYKEKYLFYSTISNLTDTLQSFNISELKEYEQGNVDKFVNYLDDFMGFVK